MAAKKILIACTSGTKLLDGRSTGCWVEEVASPYLLWTEKGFTVDIVSIAGGAVPWDEASTSGDFFTKEADTFLKNDAAAKAIKEPPSVADVLAKGIDSYDALFLPGGHGIAIDGNSDSLKQLVEKFWAAGKVVSAVCHGPCGLTNATSNGDSIVKGKKVTGFSNTEEEAVGKTKAVPFLLEDKLKELGGEYERGADWSEYAVTSGKLVTGQNPQSSRKVAELVVEALGA